MGTVILDTSMSLDGFMTADNRTPDVPLGSGGEVLTRWAIDDRRVVELDERRAERERDEELEQREHRERLTRSASARTARRRGEATLTGAPYPGRPGAPTMGGP